MQWYLQELSHTYHELLNGGMYIGKTREKKWRKRKSPCGSVFSHQEKQKNRLCIYGNLIFLTPPFFMVIFLLCYIVQEMINLCIKVHEGKTSTTFLTPYVSSLPKSNQSPISPLLSPLCSNRPSDFIFYISSLPHCCYHI